MLKLQISVTRDGDHRRTLRATGVYQKLRVARVLNCSPAGDLKASFNIRFCNLFLTDSSSHSDRLCSFPVITMTMKMDLRGISRLNWIFSKSHQHQKKGKANFRLLPGMHQITKSRKRDVVRYL